MILVALQKFKATSLLIMLLLFVKEHQLVQFPCKNERKENGLINVVFGNSFQFCCDSDKKFHSCLIERKSPSPHRRKDRCKFHFNQPIKKFGEKIPEPKQLEVYYGECSLYFSLDVIGTKIQVMEKYNQNICHLKITHMDFKGKFNCVNK